MLYKLMLTLILYGALSIPVLADSQCGPFYLGTSKEDDGWSRINGTKPESQKVTFLKEKGDYDNIKIQWMVLDANTGRYLGLDYIKRNGKPILNVEAVRRNLNEPRIFGTYDCVKVK